MITGWCCDANLFRLSKLGTTKAQYSKFKTYKQCLKENIVDGINIRKVSCSRQINRSKNRTLNDVSL